MELSPISLEEILPIHARGLALGRSSSPWDFVAEAWRSAAWALCHPHWQPCSSQRLTNLFVDLAGPVLGGPDALKEALQVRDHLCEVGDFLRLPGGEWLPAPLRLVCKAQDHDCQIIGGIPSWALVEAYPKWLGSPGFKRSSHEGIRLPKLSLQEWCDRDFTVPPLRSVRETMACIEKCSATPWLPSSNYELKNRALSNPENAPTGAWVQVRDRTTYQLVGIAERTQNHWVLKTLPGWMDGRMAHLLCQVRSGGKESWIAKPGTQEASLELYVKLPNWHWAMLLSCCIRPPVQDPVNHRWTAVIDQKDLTLLEESVFVPLQMKRI